MLPLVSILIPTYNRPHYFELALKSVINQTYKNIEIIIGDDSTNNVTEELVRTKYLPFHNNIIYVKNKKSLGQFNNSLMIYELSKGEYINFLMDDDLFHPEKIEKMMDYYLKDKDKDLKLVTSHRLLIDKDGKELEDVGATQKIYFPNTMMPGNYFVDLMLIMTCNFIGEPTTVLFRKEDLKVPFGTFDNRRYLCCVDVATWLNLLSQGYGVYMEESLSSFRLHGGQQQLNDSNKRKEGLADWEHAINVSRKYGFLLGELEYKLAMEKIEKETKWKSESSLE